MLTAGLLITALAWQGSVNAAQRARVAWVPNPRAAGGTWVSDAARHLQPATIDSINAVIGALEAATGVEIAVAVVDSLSGLSEQEFALALHRSWGVGKQDRDNGVVLLWAPRDRAVFISIGYGLEGIIPDRRAGRIRDEEIFAAFRDQRFDAGILAGVRALAAAAAEEAAVSRTGARPRGGVGAAMAADGDGGGGGGGGGIPAGLLYTGGVLGLGAAGVGGAVGLRRWRRRRPRPCPACGVRMNLMSETADDERLDSGARMEEKLGSVDWDVWLCPSCDHTLSLPYKKLFSGYLDCPECKRRTAQAGNRQQVRAPTTMSAGSAEVRHKCKHCGHAWVAFETIPRIGTTSSSGGSSFGGDGGGGGGGSFGGGSAGGGGAGGRY